MYYSRENQSPAATQTITPRHGNGASVTACGRCCWMANVKHSKHDAPEPRSALTKLRLEVTESKWNAADRHSSTKTYCMHVLIRTAGENINCRQRHIDMQFTLFNSSDARVFLCILQTTLSKNRISLTLRNIATHEVQKRWHHLSRHMQMHGSHMSRKASKTNQKVNSSPNMKQSKFIERN